MKPSLENNQKFFDQKSLDKQKRAHELFENTPVKKAVWIVAIPGLMISLMVGLYAFLDQVFILNFIPRTIPILNNDISTGTEGELYSYLSTWNKTKLNREQFDSLRNIYAGLNSNFEELGRISGDTVATIAVNATFPFAVFCNSIIFLIPVGASVYYTKCISRNTENTGKDLWSTSFYSTIIVSLATTLLLYIAIWAGLIDTIIADHKFNQTSLDMLDANNDAKAIIAAQNIGTDVKVSSVFKDYYNASNNLSLEWAKQYVYIYGAGTLIQGTYVLLSYLIRAEGRNTYVMVWAIIANIAGVILNAIFIIVLRLGVLGGVIATVLSWIINLSAYWFYIIINNKREKTWLSLKHLLKFRFKKSFLGPVALLGFSAFIRAFGVAVASFIITYLLGSLPYTEGSLSVFNWSKSTPVVTLFIIAIFGIADGARSILSYNYAKRNFDRCKEIFKWGLIISFIYAGLVTVIVLGLAPQFLWMLNALNEEGGILNQNSGPVIFLRINIGRLLLYSFATGGILLFQGTNNIKMSIWASAMEGFVTFWFVMGMFVGIGYGLQNGGASHFASSLVISFGYVTNALISGLITFYLSYRFLTKTMPNIDNIKLSWSRRAERNFFLQADKNEKDQKNIDSEKNTKP